jgi:anaerobic selenocysteine-containing dehydrogenase
MILLGGSSMHKGANGWHAARAISCLPALTGGFGLPGGGLGPRHGAQSAGSRNLSAPERRPPGNYIPNQMPDITEALSSGRLKVLLLLGTNMLSSFADAGQVAHGLDKAELGLPPLPVHKVDKGSEYPLALSFGRTLTHFHSFYDAQLWISRVDAEARQLSNGDGIKIYNERGEFGAKAHVTDDVPPGVVWIRDGWVGLNHLTSGHAVLTGDALSLFPFSVGQSNYDVKVEVSRGLASS